MPGGFAHQKIPANFDGLTFADQDYAAVNDGSLTIEDVRLPGHPWFTLNAAIWPAAGDSFNNRPFLRFNSDSGARYEYSIRAFVDIADPSAATETPSAENVKDATQMYLVPNNAAFQLTTVNKAFSCRIDLMQLAAKESYKVICHWAVGTSSASVHSRWGTTVGTWVGLGTTGITRADLFLGTAGKMEAGSYLVGHGLQSSLLGGGFVYRATELPTGKVWVDGRPVYRYTMTGLTLPAPGAITSTSLPVTGADVTTCRFTELWAYKSAAAEARRMHDMRVKFTGSPAATFVFDSPSGGFDFSTYTGVGVWEYCK